MYVDFGETWKRLSETVRNVILGENVVRRNWNDAFLDVYQICIAYPEPLHNQLYEETEVLLSNLLDVYLKEISESGPNLLETYSRIWLVYKRGAEYINKLYGYFNQMFAESNRFSNADVEFGAVISPTEQLLEAQQLALQLWKDRIIEPLQGRLVDFILNEIAKDRSGETANRKDSLTIVTSFVYVEMYKKKNILELYENIFETKYLTSTGEYYRVRASDLLVNLNCSQYMKEILALLTHEEVRSKRFLHISSYKKATKQCKDRLIFDHAEFLQAGCRKMIRENLKEDLLHMYLLLKSNTDFLKHMVSELESHIKETGLQAVKGLQKDNNISQTFMTEVLRVHSHFSTLIVNLFNNNKLFLSCLDRACTHFVNYSEDGKPTKGPELVNKYCDNVLRRCVKGGTEDAEEKLKQSLTVFRYLSDKDIFQKFYSRSLAKRLINSSAAMDVEESMINKLKEICGYEFTSKLHCMFKDITMSQDLTHKFHSRLNASGDSTDVHLNMNILQTGAWPLNATQPDFQLPQSLIKTLQKFEEFYHQQYNGRNITWLHYLSQIEVKMTISAKTYVVTMSTYQLAIALLFNDTSTLSSELIARSTNLPAKELERNLNSLVEFKILKKTTSEENGQVHFSVNSTFSHKRMRFRVTIMPTQKEQTTDAQQTRSQVDDDRKLYLQAAIVRIMKTRKSIIHNLLVQEVIAKSKDRFTPSISAIKRSIESLIDKCYLERSAESTDTYNYVA